MLYRALDLCLKAHKEQKRKEGSPYWTHPMAVRNLVRAHIPNTTVEMEIASLLHDVVEDTDTTIEYIFEAFGGTVGYYVHILTCFDKKDKEFYWKKIEESTFEAVALKAVDVFHNLSTLPVFWDKVKLSPSDIKWIKKFLKDKESMSKILEIRQDPRLSEIHELISGKTDEIKSKLEGLEKCLDP